MRTVRSLRSQLTLSNRRSAMREAKILFSTVSSSIRLKPSKPPKLLDKVLPVLSACACQSCKTCLTHAVLILGKAIQASRRFCISRASRVSFSKFDK